MGETLFDDRERRIERGTLVAVETTEGREHACLVLEVGAEELRLVDPRGHVVARIAHWADRHEPLTLSAANREMRQVLAAIGELIDEDDA